MFNMNKNYTEIMYRDSKAPYIPKWILAREKFLKTCNKMCPKCGNLLPYNAKGCDGCLLQFEGNTYKNGKRR